MRPKPVFNSPMRSFLSVAALLFVAASSQAQSWMLKSPYEAKAKFVWNVTVTANVGGMDVEAKMKQQLEIASKDEKQIKGKGNWSDITVNGDSQAEGDGPWDIVLNPNGSLVSAHDSTDHARMLTPAAFIYPDKEVKAGDKWQVKFKPAKDAKEFTSDFEVVAIEKVGDVEAMKVKAKMVEGAKEGEGMSANNLYWIGKDGKVLKFELDIKNWVVPMATGMPDFDAKVKGELVKN